MSLERLVAAAVAALLIVAAVRLARQSRRADQPILDTTTLFLAVWGVSLGLFAIPVIDYTAASPAVWLMIYGSLAAFLFGAWAARRRFANGRQPDQRVDGELSPVRVHVAWLVLGALSLIGFAFFVRAIDAQVGWRALLEDPAAARVAQFDPGFDDAYGIGKAFSYLGPVALLLWTVALRSGMFNARWKWIAPLILVFLLPYLLIGERLSLLTAAVWIAMFHLVWRPIRNPRRLIAGAAALLVAGVGYFYVIGAQKDATIDSHPEIRAQMRSDVFEPVALPYLYLTANLPVFGQMTQDPIAPTTYGQLSVLPVAKVFYKAADESPPVFGAFYEIPFDSYNSATWLGPFYTDFWVVGVLLLPALIAFLATWALIVARSRRTLLSAWLAAIGLGMIVFSPLKSQLSDAITWELVILAPVVSTVVASDPPGRIREALRVARSHLPFFLSPRALVVLSSAIAIVVLAILVALRSDRAEEDLTRESVERRINSVSGDALRTYELRGPATSHALASQLQGKDPGTYYERLPSPVDEPTTPGAIGVFADETGFLLRANTDNGEVVEAIAVGALGEFELFPPREPRSHGLVVNGDFEDAFGLPWLVTSRDGLRITQPDGGFKGGRALQVEFSKNPGTPPAAVVQGIDELPRRAAGTRFSLTSMVRTTDLTAQVAAGLVLVYTDGSSEYFPASVGSKPAASRRDATGILAGSSTDWRRLTAAGVAAKTVAAALVFILDSRAGALEGVVLVDDVKLAVGP